MRSVRWAEWYDSKLPFVFGACWLAALSGSPLSTALAARLLLFAGFYLAFGYAMNDWADRASDARAGKPNRLAALSPVAGTLLLIGLLMASLVPILIELRRPSVLVSVVAAYLLAIAYSARPLRLKERGQWGLLAAAIAQRSLLCWVVFATDDVPFSGWLYVLAITLLGLRWMLAHQLDDLAADRRSGLGTYAVRRGQTAAELQMQRLFTVEVIALAVLLGSLGWQQPLFFLIPALYLPVTLFMSRQTGEGLRQMLGCPETAYLVLSDYYFVYLLLGGCLIAVGLRAVPVVWFLWGVIWLRRHVREHAGSLLWAFGRHSGPAGHDGSIL